MSTLTLKANRSAIREFYNRPNNDENFEKLM